MYCMYVLSVKNGMDWTGPHLVGPHVTWLALPGRGERRRIFFQPLILKITDSLIKNRFLALFNLERGAC